MSNELPKVCFVALNAFPLLAGDDAIQSIGGAELQQVIIARGLAARGYPVSMICLDFGQQDDLVINGIRVIRSFRPTAGVPVIRFIWPRLTAIWRSLETADADIYYQRTASMLTGVVATFARVRKRKSIFAAAGNPDLNCRTPRIRFARDRWMYEFGLRNVDRILVQNEEQERLCRQNYGRASTLVPNCYPLEPRAPNLTARTVLWVSTIRKLKQPELFLDLAEMLPTYQFCMIGGPGNGEEGLFASMQKRASELANVEFRGFVPYAKIDEFFDNASIFINTSESEGFPNTFLQAWARAIPVVSFIDCGAYADGRSICSQVGTVKEMAGQVALWLEDDAARIQAGIRSQEYFKNRHSPEMVLGLYEQIFKELVA